MLERAVHPRAAVLNSGVNERRARRPCCGVFFCYMRQTRAFSPHPGCPPTEGRFTVVLTLCDRLCGTYRRPPAAAGAPRLRDATVGPSRQRSVPAESAATRCSVADGVSVVIWVRACQPAH